MRKILLDTHVLLWWLMDDDKLGENAHKIIRNPNNLILSVQQAFGKFPSN